MKSLLYKVSAAIILSAYLSLTAAAQADEAGKNELSVWSGGSPDSTTSLIGATADARFGILAVRYARRFNNNDAVNLRYTADFVPAAMLSYPFFQAVQTGNTFRIDTVRRRAYAYGIAPLGLQANFRPRKKVQPFVGASGGFLYFNKQVLDFNGTHFNFTVEAGGGVDFRMRKNRAVTLGYKYYHISNANRAVENPGFDNNLFYIGYRFLSK